MAREKASYGQKSGVKSTTEYVTILGGVPPTKSVEQINSENEPKKAPNSVGK